MRIVVSCRLPFAAEMRRFGLARCLLGTEGSSGSDKQEAAILELTQNAVAALRRVIAETGDTDIRGIRIAASGGCSGYQYELGLEAEAREGDAVIPFGDMIVFVDAGSKAALSGVEVDFCDSPQAAGFVFHQPNGCGSCGKRQACGS